MRNDHDETSIASSSSDDVSNTNNYDNMAIPPERYVALLSWVTNSNNNATQDNTNFGVSVQPSRCGHGRGLFATESFQRSQTVLRIPSEKRLTLATAYKHDRLGPALERMAEEYGYEGQLEALTGFLASELLHHHTNTSSSSDLAPYLAVLPHGPGGGGQQDHVLWWSDEEFQTLVTPDSVVYGDAVELREWREARGSLLLGLLVSDLAKQPQHDNNEEANVTVSQVDHTITTALVHVLSRALPDDDEDAGGGLQMIPLLDMAQHSNKPNMEFRMDKATGNIVAMALRDVEAREELTMEYYYDTSSLSAKANGHEYFVAHGFVPGETRAFAEREMFRNKSFVFFPAASSRELQTRRLLACDQERMFGGGGVLSSASVSRQCDSYTRWWRGYQRGRQKKKFRQKRGDGPPHALPLPGDDDYQSNTRSNDWPTPKTIPLSPDEVLHQGRMRTSGQQLKEDPQQKKRVWVRIQGG